MAKTKKVKEKKRVKDEVVVVENVEEAFEEPKCWISDYTLRFRTTLENKEEEKYLMEMSLCRNGENEFNIISKTNIYTYEFNIFEFCQMNQLYEYGHREYVNLKTNMDEIVYSCGSIEISDPMLCKIKRAFCKIDIDEQLARIELLFIGSPDYADKINNMTSFVINYIKKANDSNSI